MNSSGTTGSALHSSSVSRSNIGCAAIFSAIHRPSSSTSVMVYTIPPTASVYAYSDSNDRWMIRRRWFAVLKCGSGNRKNSFVSCPFWKKLGKYFMLFVRMQEMFSYDPGCSRRSATHRSFTYWLTLSRISMPTARSSGNRGESRTSRPPKPHPTSAKRTRGGV